MADRLVATLPPKLSVPEAMAFARRARALGADLLELRTDLYPDPSGVAGAVARVLPILAAERAGVGVCAELRGQAALLDQEIGDPAPGAARAGATLLSHHAPAPLSPTEALARWTNAAPGPGVHLKHVEPLGAAGEGARLLETQRRLSERFGPERVTVLATGLLALPFRAVLAAGNALEYVAVEPSFFAAPGQRLLADAVRARPHEGRPGRLGILGHAIANSRSPRIHPQPFDRIDLPEDAPVGALVDALSPFYRGFAITSPFKQPLARHVGADLPAINTLFRREGGWGFANTDVEGARAVLTRLRAPEVIALGDGGATAALRLATAEGAVRLRVLRRDALRGPLRLPAIWTWPPWVQPPEGLRFDGARVAVIAYGEPGRQIAARIRQLGGQPVPSGAAWFVAQARGQRRLWESAT